MRRLYRLLILLHPPAFRQQFGDEMLWIFDESRSDRGPSLFGDGVVSVVRQWVIRRAIWKYPTAAAAAGLIFSLCSALAHVRPALPAYSDESTEMMLLLSASATVVALSLTILFSVVWFRRSRSRRA